MRQNNNQITELCGWRGVSCLEMKRHFLKVSAHLHRANERVVMALEIAREMKRAFARIAVFSPLVRHPKSLSLLRDISV